jgi:hypothetical protein
VKKRDRENKTGKEFPTAWEKMLEFIQTSRNSRNGSS